MRFIFKFILLINRCKYKNCKNKNCGFDHEGKAY